MSSDRYRAGKRLWSTADDARLRRIYPNEPTAAVAQTLRRTVFSVYGRADLLGLRKSEAYLASPAACRLRREDFVGAATRFKPGHTPANKGSRRPGWFAGRMKTTQFKKGQAQHTWVTIGTETRDPDGYLKRKVADDRTKASRFNWRFVHVLVWTEAHGPVPHGFAVAFKNGDKTDIREENLELISRRELMARNTVHNLPKPLAQTIHLLGALKRQIRRRTRLAEEQDSRSA